MRRAPVAVALDAPDLDTAVEWARVTSPHVTTMKVGLELFLRHGRQAVDAVRSVTDAAVFLDLKLHDIPNTVAGAARAVADLEPAFLTVHASGGAAMVRAAAEALPGTQVTGVTVLTSLTDDDVAEVGWSGPAADAVLRLARLAVAAGARALVCSPQEVAAVRAAVGPAVTLITPGVRPPGAGDGDQARVATPAQALADGADLLVVGRPITAAAEPGEAAATLAAALVGPAG
ncbi:MAG: orotidine-5'-phosphate decarboxylase [Actinomycetota bacterium]|nr:orotidine-5'-phosphate decarboxylase [Actinomycetota bacterium]MDH5278822.1 orotidine-5'-phosphate decarboxylase [Actinomycetota bacterium]